MSEERDCYAEIRDIVEDWLDEAGIGKSYVMMKLETIVDDAEEE
tara:strand:+ start:833 stop:964 length:132 start_codon:yes stop_codon:yes gene_type:complete